MPDQGQPPTSQGGGGPRQGGASLPDDETVRQILVERLGEHADAYGIVVGLLDASETHIVAHGKRDRSDPRSVDGDTLFEIGSISKGFTSVLLADAVHRGEVTPDDPADRFLPASVSCVNDSGPAIAVTLHQDGVDQRAPRIE